MGTPKPSHKKQDKNKSAVKVVYPKKSSKPPVKKDNGLTDIHRKFFKNEGFDIYSYARSQGYGPKAAAFFLELAAQEVGYGNEVSVGKADVRHNYFGDLQADGSTIQTFKTKEEGIEYEMKNWIGLFHRLYPKAESILQKDNPSDAELDEAIKDYNHDPNGKAYASWLKKNDANGVNWRAIKTIDEEIANIDKEAAPYYQELSLLNTSEYYELSDKYEKPYSDILTKLKNRKDDLLHIKAELQTGQADNKYFAAPKVYGNFSDNLIKWPAGVPEPPYNNPDDNQNELYPDIYSNGYSDMFKPGNLLTKPTAPQSNSNLSQPANDSLLNPGKYSGDHANIFLPKILLPPQAKQHKHKKISRRNKSAGDGTGASNNFSIPGSGSFSPGYSSGSSTNNLFAKSNPNNSFGLKSGELNSPTSSIGNNNNSTRGPEENFAPANMFGGEEKFSNGLMDGSSGGMSLSASNNLFSGKKNNGNDELKFLQPDISFDNGGGSMGNNAVGSNSTPLNWDGNNSLYANENNSAVFSDSPSLEANNLFSNSAGNNSFNRPASPATQVSNGFNKSATSNDGNDKNIIQAPDKSLGAIKSPPGDNSSFGQNDSPFKGGMFGGGPSNQYNNNSGSQGKNKTPAVTLQDGGSGKHSAKAPNKNLNKGGKQITPPKEHYKPANASGNLFNQQHHSPAPSAPGQSSAGNSVNPNHVQHPSGSKSSGKSGGVTFHVQNMSHHANTHKHAVKSSNEIHKHVVEILTDAVADSKIGTDVH